MTGPNDLIKDVTQAAELFDHIGETRDLDGWDTADLAAMWLQLKWASASLRYAKQQVGEALDTAMDDQVNVDGKAWHRSGKPSRRGWKKDALNKALIERVGVDVHTADGERVRAVRETDVVSLFAATTHNRKLRDLGIDPDAFSEVSVSFDLGEGDH